MLFYWRKLKTIKPVYTGEALDIWCNYLGIARHENETDEELRNRILTEHYGVSNDS